MRQAPAADYPGQQLRLPVDRDGSSPLTVDEASLEIWPGRSTAVLAVIGMMPGLTIRVRWGEIFQAQSGINSLRKS